MKRQLRKLVLDAVIDSPLEHVLRTAYVRLRPTKNNKYDRQLTQVMRRTLNSHSTCIDVGCYRGEVLREMIRLAPDGKHFAFEPVFKNFRFLTEKFSKATIHNVALSDYAGEGSFQHVVDRPALSGLYKVDYPDRNQDVREIRVSVDCLDNIVPEDVPIDFVKIDVEGAELSVLRGGRKLIKASRPVIVFEHGWKRAKTYGTTPEDIYDMLTAEFRLHVSLMDRWLRGQRAFNREEFCRAVYDSLEFCFIAYPLTVLGDAEMT